MFVAALSSQRYLQEERAVRLTYVVTILSWVEYMAMRVLLQVDL